MQKLHKNRFLASFSAKNTILHENNTSFCTFLRSIRVLLQGVFEGNGPHEKPWISFVIDLCQKVVLIYYGIYVGADT